MRIREIGRSDAGLRPRFGLLGGLVKGPQTGGSVRCAAVQPGASWCKFRGLCDTERSVRQSVSIPAGIAKRVRTLARAREKQAPIVCSST